MNIEEFIVDYLQREYTIPQDPFSSLAAISFIGSPFIVPDLVGVFSAIVPAV